MPRRRARGKGFTITYGPAPERRRRPWMDPTWTRPEKRANLAPGSSVRFGPDYHGDLPVWGISWDDPPLSRELLVALTKWQEEFDQNYRLDSGWPDREFEQAWQEEGERLLSLLRHELGQFVTVERDTWLLSEPSE